MLKTGVEPAIVKCDTQNFSFYIFSQLKCTPDLERQVYVFNWTVAGTEPMLKLFLRDLNLCVQKKRKSQ